MAAAFAVSVPTAGAAAPPGCTESDISGLIVRAVVASGGFGDSGGTEQRLPVSMSVANYTGRALRNVEARQALDGELAGAVIAGSPTASSGGVEYDARGLMWQGHLASNQVADVTYALSAPEGSAAQRALRDLHPGSRLDTTITASSAECG